MQSPEHTRAATISGVRIRWRVFAMLAGFGTIVYFQQRSVTVAADRIMPELSLSQMQVGWLQWAFILSYGLLQFPGGIFGQRLGARRALSAMMLVAVFAAAILPLTPLVLSGTALFAALFASQFLLGMAHAPFMPVCAGVMESWLPPNRYALAQGLDTGALQLGAALAPPVIVLLMQAFGWQRALFWAALPPLLLIGVWAWYGRNTPAEHPSVSVQELGELDPASNEPPDATISLARAGRILTNRAVLLLTLSYISMNYVFYLLANWCFLYLIQVRHFTSLEGGFLASLPPLAAAAGAGSGGVITERLCGRFGLKWGYRLLPLIALPLAGGLLIAAVASVSAYGAVVALALAFGVIELTEGAYWASTMRIARADSMAATGVLNTGGNLGGIIGVPIVAYLSGHHAWTATFVLGLAFAVLAGVAWLGVDASRPMDVHESPSAP